MLCFTLGIAAGLWAAEDDPAKKAPAAAKKPPPAVDLLKLVPARPGFAFVRGTLVTPPATGGQTPVAYKPPAEYDLELVAERIGGIGDLHVCVIHGANRCWAVFDGVNGTISGISMIDGQWASANPTTYRGRVFPDTGTVKLKIRVRSDGIAAETDGKTLYDWKGPPGRVSVPNDPGLPRDALALGIYNGSRFRIHSFKLTPVSGEGKRLPLR